METTGVPPGENKKSKFLILASVLLFLLIVLLVIIISRRNNQSGLPAQNTQINQVGDGMMKKSPAEMAIQAPTALFGSWTGLQATETYPTSASVYTFKTDLTFDEAQTMLNKLGFTANIDTENNAVVAYNLGEDRENASVAAVDLANGNLAYNSTDGVKLPAGATLEAKTIAFLRSLGLYDTTMEVSAQYKSRKHEGVTFVEVHRSWQKVGLPVLNPVGLLNIPESQTVSSLSLETANLNSATDADIYATTDNADGRGRSDDFNTITLGINDANQTVTFIKSSMRPFATAAPTTRSLITYDEAVAMLKAGAYEFLYNTPSGGGSGVPWEKIYPGNTANAQTANVQEAVLVYLENDPHSAQSELAPYYLFRGTAQLDSGYMTAFIAAVPAGATAQSRGFVSTVAAQETTDTGQKQGTFEMDSTQQSQIDNPLTPTVPPPIGVGQPLPPAGGDQSVCVPPVGAMNPVIQYAGVYFGYTQRPGRNSMEWYYIPTADNVPLDAVLIADLQTLVNTLQAALSGNPVVEPPLQTTQPATVSPTIFETNVDDQGQKQSTFEVPTVAQVTYAPPQVIDSELDIRKFKKIIDDIQDQIDYCPVRLTGSSPTLFVYTQDGQSVTVDSAANVSYADPYGVNGSQWIVETQGGRTTVNGIERDYVYYEYTGASFAQPEKGWIIRKSGIAAFVSSEIAPALGLTKQEEKRTVFELTHAASSVISDELFVGLISEKEVAEQLPLNLNPQPQVTARYHFYVSPATATAGAPELKAITRAPFSAVEIGSFAGN